MAKIGPAGVETTSLPEYIQRLQELLREALGNDLNFEPETPQTQLVGVLALPFTEADELGAHVAAGMSLQTASGNQLDAWGSFFGIPRIPGTRSTVEVTISGNSGTLVPEGSRVRTETGAVFRSRAATTIPSGGTINVDFESEDLGPIHASAGELKVIIDVLRGWTGATNAADAVLGTEVESDSAYRFRYGRVIARSNAGTLSSMESIVRSVSGVADALVIENATSARVASRGVTTDANSVSVIALGGSAAQIAAAIAGAKPVGIGTGTTRNITGQVSTTVRTNNVNRAIRHYAASDVPVKVAVTTTKDSENYPSDGDARIRAGLVEFFSELRIGDSPDQFRMQAATTAIPGHTLTSISVRRKSPDAALGTVTLLERLSLADGDVTV